MRAADSGNPDIYSGLLLLALNSTKLAFRVWFPLSGLIHHGQEQG
jgi:hypothetical protein